MPTFRLIACGHFAGTDGPRLVGVPEFENAMVAGFYTTRIVEAGNCEEAGRLAADSIHDELSQTMGKEKAAHTLEIESCEDVTGENDPGPTRGFTFFSEE